MSLFHNHPDFYRHPIHLSEEHRKNPSVFLHKFFNDYNLCDLRAMLAEIAETCLTTNTPPFNESDKRGNLILLLKNMECLLEVAFIVATKDF